jgi:hypothetical protein
MVVENREDLRRRKRGVQEEPQPPVAAETAQLLAERDQMVVLDPDDVAVLEQRHEPFGEQLLTA